MNPSVKKIISLLLLAATSCNLFYCTNRAEMLRQVENRKNSSAFQYLYKNLLPDDLSLYLDPKKEIAVGIVPEMTVEDPDVLYRAAEEYSESLKISRLAENESLAIYRRYAETGIVSIAGNKQVILIVLTGREYLRNRFSRFEGFIEIYNPVFGALTYGKRYPALHELSPSYRKPFTAGCAFGAAGLFAFIIYMMSHLRLD